MALTGCEVPFSQADGVGGSETARQQLASLRIAPELEVDYDRDDWLPGGWMTCVREEVLQRDADDLVAGKGCKVPDGQWTSPYDGEVISHPSDVDVDHVVPLGDAARSGGHEWPEGRRIEFANDTRFLVAVSQSSNRSKGDDDPADWLPERADYVCEYVQTWIAAKAEYDLTADQAEHDALTRELQGC